MRESNEGEEIFKRRLAKIIRTTIERRYDKFYACISRCSNLESDISWKLLFFTNFNNSKQANIKNVGYNRGLSGEIGFDLIYQKKKRKMFNRFDLTLSNKRIV